MCPICRSVENVVRIRHVGESIEDEDVQREGHYVHEACMQEWMGRMGLAQPSCLLCHRAIAQIGDWDFALLQKLPRHVKVAKLIQIALRHKHSTRAVQTIIHWMDREDRNLRYPTSFIDGERTYWLYDYRRQITPYGLSLLLQRCAPAQNIRVLRVLCQDYQEAIQNMGAELGYGAVENAILQSSEESLRVLLECIQLDPELRGEAFLLAVDMHNKDMMQSLLQNGPIPKRDLRIARDTLQRHGRSDLVHIVDLYLPDDRIQLLCVLFALVFLLTTRLSIPK